MKQSRFMESQIATILEEAEGGIAIAEVLHSNRISAVNFINGRLNLGS